MPSQLCHPLARTEDTSDESWHAHLHIQLVPVQRRAPRHHSNRGNLLRLCAVQALDKRAGHDEDDAVTKLDDQTVVRQAYLRTLSRLPTPDEFDRCLAYLADNDSPAAGAKGLLWTLLNTKEFIVNH